MKTFVFVCMGFLALTLSFLCISCGPSQSSEGNETDADSTGMMEQTVDIVSPGKIVYVVHDLVEYDPWEREFIAHDAVRKQYGLHLNSVMRDMDNDKKAHIVLAAADLDKAREFTNSEDLKAVMERGGVIGPPIITFLNVEFAELVDTDIPTRLFVSHRVKDYAAWKTVFDEHKAKRMEYGLTDRLVARVDGDPNRVVVSFLAAEQDRAKEFIASEDLKVTMEKAGVEGPVAVAYARLCLRHNMETL